MSFNEKHSPIQVAENYKHKNENLQSRIKKTWTVPILNELSKSFLHITKCDVTNKIIVNTALNLG